MGVMWTIPVTWFLLVLHCFPCHGGNGLTVIGLVCWSYFVLYLLQLLYLRAYHPFRSFIIMNKWLRLFNPTVKLNHTLILSFILILIHSFIHLVSQSVSLPVSHPFTHLSVLFIIHPSIHHRYHADVGCKTLLSQSRIIQPPLSVFS